MSLGAHLSEAPRNLLKWYPVGANRRGAPKSSNELLIVTVKCLPMSKHASLLRHILSVQIGMHPALPKCFYKIENTLAY